MKIMLLDVNWEYKFFIMPEGLLFCEFWFTFCFDFRANACIIIQQTIFFVFWSSFLCVIHSAVDGLDEVGVINEQFRFVNERTSLCCAV